MKLLVIFVVLCAAQCQAGDYYYRGRAHPGPIEFPPVDPDWPNVDEHIKGLTNSPMHRAAETLASVIGELQEIKGESDQHGWAGLSNYLDHWIKLLQQHQKVETPKKDPPPKKGRFQNYRYSTGYDR